MSNIEAARRQFRDVGVTCDIRQNYYVGMIYSPMNLKWMDDGDKPKSRNTGRRRMITIFPEETAPGG